MSHEQFERMWFCRIVATLMLGCISFGAIPIIKTTLFPVEKIR
jgi:hypothetical protein